MVDGHRSHAPALIRPAEARYKTASIWGRSSILDFGCARLIRSQRPLCDPWAAIYGTDVDATAIASRNDNIADASFSVDGQNPPLASRSHQSDFPEIDLILPRRHRVSSMLQASA
jgi:hypothetical protein